MSGEQHQRRKRKHGQTGDAGTYIKPMLVRGRLERDPGPGAAAGPVQPAGPPFRRDKNPGAKKKAIIAIAHTLLKIAYHTGRYR